MESSWHRQHAGVSMTPQFPLHYTPRPYQVELHKMWADKRVGVAVLPRQTGKDVAMSMEIIRDRLATPKSNGVYIGLSNPDIKDIVWDKTYPLDNGQYIHALRDNIPDELVTWSNTVMEGRFSNGSMLKFKGYFQSGEGKSGVGTSFKDYAITELGLFFREDPVTRIEPIINRGSNRLMVASTPRGKRNNPLWKLIESWSGRKDFQVITRTIDDINEIMVREGLNAVLSPHELEQIKESYLKRFGNDRMFEQEYYCSFDEMDAAAVYGEAYRKLIEEKRNEDFNINPNHPVYVVFDIGSSGKHSDATSWIAFQWYNEKLFLYDCGEGHGKALPEYVDVLREKHYFNQIDTIILPWDGEHHEKAINTTPADMMRQKFPRVSVLAKSNKVYKVPGRSQWGDTITDIQATRMALYNTYLHGTNCDWLSACLENYKYEYSNKLQEWTSTPLHDKYSHMMDALRYAVQATKELQFFAGGFMGHNDKTVDYTKESWGSVWA